LLDDGLLSGQYEVVTVLRPERFARPVHVDDLAGALAEIKRACQVWGGGGQPLLPVDGDEVPPAYTSLLCREQIDGVGGLKDIPVRLPRRVERHRPWDHPAILVAASEALEKWRPVQVVELAADDPWLPIYYAVLGTLPEVPDSALSDFAGLRDDLRFEEIVPVDRVRTTGSLEDLIRRIEDRDTLTPRELSTMFLSYGTRPDTSFMRSGDEILPDPSTARRAAGPNLIVAFTGGSVEDLALLWNLRGAHGYSRVMPIGLPRDAVTPDVLRELQQPGRAAMFGWSGGKCHLVSASVPLDELEALAEQSRPVEAMDYQALLTFGPAPGRVRSHVTSWEDGHARVAPMSDGDREILRHSRSAMRQPRLVLDVTVEDRPLPADETMRGTDIFGRFQAGAAQVSVSELRERDTVEVHWPSSWTCLAAVAQSRGLDVEESQPGLAAATLIRAVGGVDMIRLLQHQPLISLLYRMAEVSGMSWWKKKWTAARAELVEAGADPATLEEAAVVLGRDEPVIAPPGEGRALPFQDFVAALGTEPAARHWVAWAERCHLLVRGAEVVCPDCKTETWLPLAALPPPVACPGCGRQIDQPYGPRDLKFTYRIGEPLRRVLETDSLGHVLALHWFVRLFDRKGLVGAHPGVTFTDPSDKGKTIGEADVLLLFADGSLVPIEVKRRVAGVDARTMELMDTLADALEARWDALVVTQPARDIAALQDSERRLPARPRVLVTDDQLHEHVIIWQLGVNPFGWEPRTEEDDAERRKAFTAWLTTNAPDVPWWRVSDTLLDKNLNARQS
jgi:hypothetical protein